MSVFLQRDDITTELDNLYLQNENVLSVIDKIYQNGDLIYSSFPNIVVPNLSDYPVSAYSLKDSTVSISISNDVPTIRINPQIYWSGACLRIDTTQATTLTMDITWKPLGNTGNAFCKYGFNRTASFNSGNIKEVGPKWPGGSIRETITVDVAKYEEVYLMLNSGTGNQSYSSGGSFTINSLVLV